MTGVFPFIDHCPVSLPMFHLVRVPVMQLLVAPSGAWRHAFIRNALVLVHVHACLNRLLLCTPAAPSVALNVVCQRVTRCLAAPVVHLCGVWGSGRWPSGGEGVRGASRLMKTLRITAAILSSMRYVTVHRGTRTGC